ncbi:DNA repair exonuclease SbcCD nuclease subunit [Parabacteroides sp. PF5-5]|uniref:metallophosphoesterase n=2 Tax=unclassified Parabacteroides TaxID=2649774 RepID=UPI00247381BE|nr:MULTISPECIES: metallophosphoesterase [unclassified Parabacteroides]MDH6322457.1 DNA repair exonuclease SbcCD nuclease subunit [Parabacteroides sp. PH5-8]MDH6334208.1 DNA repair exonuclease SbcCD nuclease subunit [Parabacteroides sp. PF5-5]MDH6383718.1 DNA repair exonuclease SbcCD nuclease subunit [Parabacteroides sp. PH5-17]MDH6392948.1 DNA repair exonuclease SbcCD nuclease subunit [Parabacteroides sp. PFB2-22]MDH6304218.1 DNA repair exonuclease SbcCD nuclease subunit [Parabacteroides sp. P
MSDNFNRIEMLNNIRFENIDALLFCGDIHGEFETIVYKLNQYDNAVLIVCGDIGMGFYKNEYYLTLFRKLNLRLSKKNNHLVMFRGNHDDPDFFNGSFKKHKHIHLLEDYSIVQVGATNVLCVGGATSIDRTYRIEREQQTGKKTYWGAAELPYFDEERLNEINRVFPNDIDIVATHTIPSFAYPTTKQGIGSWLKEDEGLEQVIDQERATMDLIFAKLQERQKNIIDWYYGHFHEHKLERHYDINFRLCDCGEINEFRERRMEYD